jgi:hypothetical protein
LDNLRPLAEERQKRKDADDPLGQTLEFGEQ